MQSYHVSVKFMNIIGCCLDTFKNESPCWSWTSKINLQ
jgi:hypothetical protein